MAPKLIAFPTRKSAYAPERSYDSLARDTQPRDTQQQACRIAEQVQREIARQSERHITGARPSRVSHRVLVMPAAPTPRQARRQRLLSMFLNARVTALATVAGIFSL